MAKPRAPTKRIRKEIKSIRKTITAEKKRASKLTKGINAVRKRTDKTVKTVAARTAKSVKVAARAAKNVRKVAARTAGLGKDMDALRSRLEELAKKKTTKKQLSEFNLFMRRQLRDGKTFKSAIKLWKAYKRGRSIIKTRVVKKIVSRPRIVTKTRIVTRKVPVVKTRTIIKRVPITKVRTVVREVPAPEKPEFGESVSALEARLSDIINEGINEGLSKKGVEAMVSDEELAMRLVTVYFQEVHRLGLKRRLELDDVVSAYFEALTKVRGKNAQPAASAHNPAHDSEHITGANQSGH